MTCETAEGSLCWGVNKGVGEGCPRGIALEQSIEGEVDTALAWQVLGPELYLLDIKKKEKWRAHE